MRHRRLQEDGVYVVSVGAQTPVGRSALKSAAAVRCGLSAYQEHPFMTDRHGESIVVAAADWISIDATPAERVTQFAVDALREIVADWGQSSRSQIPVIVALSASTFPTESEQNAVVQRTAARLGESSVSAKSRVFAEGNAVGVLAVQHAVTRLHSGEDRAVVVLGVDSYLGPSQLDALDYSGRIHSINNSWGFTPGEGAGAMLLMLGATVEREGLKPLAQICAVALGEESKLLGTRTICIGEGLTKAFQGVVSNEDRISYSYCDLNGETYRADEFGFAVCRSGEGFDDASSFSAAAACWGDVGAASVPLQVVLATAAWSRGYAKGSNVLCWSSSATAPLRGAIRLCNPYPLDDRA